MLPYGFRVTPVRDSHSATSIISIASHGQPSRKVPSDPCLCTAYPMQVGIDSMRPPG
jgi:hypothetical protein